MVKRAKTIAEYAIRKWINDNFCEGCVHIASIVRNEAIIKDQSGETMTVIYDPATRVVEEKEKKDEKSR